MIKQLITTQTIAPFGHATEFLSSEYTITPTLDGYWVQGPSRAAHLPRNICIPVFEGSNVAIPEWIGVVAPEEETLADNAGKRVKPKGGALVSP